MLKPALPLTPENVAVMVTEPKANALTLPLRLELFTVAFDVSEEVQVAETEANELLILELQVAKADIGKIIGKQGRTARAIRTVLQASAAKLGNARH